MQIFTDKIDSLYDGCYNFELLGTIVFLPFFCEFGYLTITPLVVALAVSKLAAMLF